MYHSTQPCFEGLQTVLLRCGSIPFAMQPACSPLRGQCPFGYCQRENHLARTTAGLLHNYLHQWGTSVHQPFTVKTQHIYTSHHRATKQLRHRLMTVVKRRVNTHSRCKLSVITAVTFTLTNMTFRGTCITLTTY